MSEAGQAATQLTQADIQTMDAWFRKHRPSNHNGARTLEEYLVLIKYALDNSHTSFLGTAVRFFHKVGGEGFGKIRSVDDLKRLVGTVKP